MNIGDLVKFAVPMNEGEATERFIMLEDRGPRVLVELVGSGMSITPTFVYLAADLVAA